MTPDRTPQQVFIVAWAFQVKPEHQRDFEWAYGSQGDWVRLFRTGDGYLKTELHREPENRGRYITLDFWRSQEQYEAFREQAHSAYREIDARCERLTENEELVGNFRDLTSLHKALPDLGPATQVAPLFTIRPAQRGDMAEVQGLEQAAASAAHWTQETYEGIARNDAPTRIALVAENLESRLCGFVVARIIADECELENIVVESGAVRQGIGSALLDELAQTARTRGAKRIFLEVRESNLPARGLYQKFGFQCDGERDAYYSDPIERAILYSLTL